MIYLYISESTAFRLSFNINKIGRFSQCKLQLVRGNVVENLSEDYLYVLVEEILGRIRNIPNLENRNAIGNIGKWQEYYYFDSEYNNKHAVEIETMEKAIFFSAEKYGSFLYKYDNKNWLELNKSFCDSYSSSPVEYYSDPDNYRILLSYISYEMVENWKKQLEVIEEQL